jgi:iron complex outermembrane receptor protein
MAAVPLFAQSQVTGRVTDSKTGEGVAGVGVVVKGTTTGTVTDADGRYNLDPKGGTTLVYTSIGYKPQEVEIGGRTSIDITFEEDIAILSDVVVVGYGEVEKKDVTGAMATIKSKDFNAGVISSPEQLIQGRAAGVQITSTSGEPGAGVNIRIRGTSSVRSGNNPLYVVDGVPLAGDETQSGGLDFGLGASAPRNPLNFLNPNDIASIDILKDASATAIYGSRGANGVVIITTKRGQEGKGTLEYSYALSVSSISKKYDILDREGFLDAYEALNGATARASVDGGANTDWQDEIFRTAITHSHNFSFGGSDKTTSYMFALSYMDQEGIIERSNLKRFTARFNGSKKFMNDRLTISTQLTIADNRDGNIPITQTNGFEGDVFGNALKFNPSQPIRNADGTFYQPSTSEINPVAFLALSKDDTKTLRALGNLGAEFKIIEGLSFKTVLGLDRSYSDRKAAYSRDLRTEAIQNKGRAYFADVQVDNRLWENYFTYKKNFGKVSLDALLGYSYQQFNLVTSGFEMTNFRTSDLDLMLNNIASLDASGGKGIVPVNSSNIKDELQSFYTRFTLGFSNKYVFTATVRSDGSTKFGSGNKYGVFPSFAFKWRIIEESFAPKIFSDLNLRLGYGVTGNQEIPHNLYQQRQRFGNWDINTGGDVVGGGLGDVAFANPDLKWETTAQFNAGLDFGFWNNRITGSLDFYNKNTNDLLIQVVSAQPAAQPFVWRNLDADVVNTGVELSLSVVALDGDKLKWTVGGNVSYNKNEVKNFAGLINTGRINGQGLTGAFAQRIAQGQPLFAFFLREFGGYDDNGISIYPSGDVQQFVNASPLPKVILGFTNDLKYGNFDLNIFFSGQFGQYVYNNTANALFTAGALGNGRNVSADVPGSGESRLNAPDVSTRFLEKADFVRLQNITLGYNLALKSKMISSVRFYINGQNLFVISGYSGQDPEVSTNKAIDGVPSAGIDYSAYPRARTFTFGANIRF